MKFRIKRTIMSLLLSTAMIQSSIGALSVFAADSDVPVITVTAKDEFVSKIGDLDRYCNLPTITVSAVDGKTITKVDLTINNKEKPEENVETSGLGNQTVTLILPESTSKYLRLYKIDATDSAGVTASLSIYAGHVLGSREAYVFPATCTTPEKTVSEYVCQICHEVYDRSEHISTTPPVGSHDWNIETKDGCNGSYTLKTCKTCGTKEYADDTSSTQHQWSDYTEEKATCTIDSRRYRTCQSCGFVEEDLNYTKTAARGHSYNYVSYIPTCTEPGSQYYACGICREKKEGTLQTYAPLGHNYVQVTEPATCEAPGRTYKKCTRKACQDVIDEVEIPKLDHNWVEGNIVKEAPCGGTGTREYRCSVCNTTEEREYTQAHIPLAVDGDCTVTTKCSVCGATLAHNSDGHNFSGGYTVTKDGHRRACVNPGCEQLGDVVPHSAVDDGTCSTALICECGYQIEPGYPSHNSPTHDGWFNDETHHWRVCTREGCVQKIQSAPHVAKDDGNCETAVICSVCNFEVTQAKIHTLESSYDSNGHFDRCTNDGCSYTTNVQEHIMGYTSDNSGHWLECDICDYADITSRSVHTHVESDHDCTTPVVCDSCGWTIIEAFAEHQLNSTLSHDKEHHWYECSNPDCQVKTDMENHTASKMLKQIDKMPTCTEDGIGKVCMVCETCGRELYSYTYTIDASHSYSEVVTPPTCTSEGYTTYTCSVCGDSYKDKTKPATGHTWGEWEIIDSPKCADDGAQKRSCKTCGAIEQKGVSANGHVWENDYEVDMEANCVEDGSKSIHCSVCDAIKPESSVTIPALGHSFTKFTENDDATCTSDGTKTAKCDRCDETYTETIPGTMIPHDWGNWDILSNPTCTEEGRNIRYCNVCNTTETEEVPALNHKFGDWIVRAEATCIIPGTESHYCEICGEIESRETEPLGHIYENDVCVRCGSVMYTAVVGNNGIWNKTDKNANSGLTIKVNTVLGDLSKLIEIRINGELLDSSDYTLDGNIITILSKYLTTLKSGSYEIILLYSDGGVKAVFEVQNSVTKPDTSSSNPTNKPSNVSQKTKATRSPQQVQKDKKNAKKIMKQAKITNLKVKSKSKKTIAVSWKKVSKAVGYEVQISKAKKFNKGKIVFEKFTTRKKLIIKNINKIKSKKTYYVRVRAYATYMDKNNKPQKVYSKWIKKVRMVKVK